MKTGRSLRGSWNCVAGVVTVTLLLLTGCGGSSGGDAPPPPSADLFRNETFGNEAFFGGILGLHPVLNGVSPTDAVALSVQVDLDKVL